MIITFDWLKDHLKTNLKEKNLLEQLTNIGLEVESLESLSADNELFKVAEIIKTEKHPNAVATITHDDRGNGYCLFRLNDSSKIDFSLIENDKRVLFAHKNGFVAKTHDKLKSTEIIELFEKSST